MPLVFLWCTTGQYFTAEINIYLVLVLYYLIFNPREYSDPVLRIVGGGGERKFFEIFDPPPPTKIFHVRGETPPYYQAQILENAQIC